MLPRFGSRPQRPRRMRRPQRLFRPRLPRRHGSDRRVQVKVLRWWPRRGGTKVGTGVAVLVGVIVLLAAGYGVYSLLSMHRTLPFSNFSVNKVTEEGNVDVCEDLARRKVHPQHGAGQGSGQLVAAERSDQQHDAGAASGGSLLRVQWSELLSRWQLFLFRAQ